MRQEQFVARHQHEWQAFEQWLDTSEQKRDDRHHSELADEQMPGAYRRICEHLALARKRGYSPYIAERLQHLMQRGHAVIYRTPPPRWRRAIVFVLADFPRLVRSEAACMWISAVLFALPMLTIFAWLQHQPDLIHGIMNPEQIASIESMYDPNNPRHSSNREAESNWYMFGVYIMNNTSIGLRTFASGLLGCLGAVYVLIFNGVTIGAVFGHLQQIGSGDPLWQFVVGHAPFELTAIVISGGAGLRLGFNLIAPGRQRRMDALVQAGWKGARICLGAALMFFIAAFIEAFWSSNQAMAAWVKYAASITLWVVVVLWLWRGGRGRVDEA